MARKPRLAIMECFQKTLMGATADENHYIFVKLFVAIIEIHFFFIERNKQNERKTVQSLVSLFVYGVCYCTRK